MMVRRAAVIEIASVRCTGDAGKGKKTKELQHGDGNGC